MIKNRNIPRGPLLLMAGLAVFAATAAGAFYGQFDYSELCTVCGRARNVVEWQVPGTQRTYYSVREELATALSQTLEAKELVVTHGHQWQFVRGEGNGRTIVLGAGHPIVWSMHSPHMGTFLQTMLHWTDRSTTLLWVDLLRDPRYSRLCQAMADAARRRTFGNREEWETWLRDFEVEHSQLIDRTAELP